jgi:hypothetical protein
MSNCNGKELYRLLGQKVSYRPVAGRSLIRMVLVRKSKDVWMGLTETGAEITIKPEDVFIHGKKIVNISGNNS